MLNLWHFNQQGEPVELEMPCFWSQFLVPEAGHQKIGLCVMGLSDWYSSLNETQQLEHSETKHTITHQITQIIMWLRMTQHKQ